MSARILVVDDEANIRALIDEILSEEGYDVTTAADARHARAARKDNEFDLILLDIWMPDTDGITLLTRVRRSRFNASSDATSFESTLGCEASVYFSGVRPGDRLNLPCLSR